MSVPDDRIKKPPLHVAELVPAAVFLATWISPRLTRFLDDDIGNSLSMCMWLEFIMGHAGTAFAVVSYTEKRKRGRVAATILFGLLYSAFVIGFSVVTRSYYPLIQFGLVFYGRIGATAGEAQGDFKLASVLLAASRVFLLLITAGFAAAFPLPKLGATPEAIHMVGEGRMIEFPHMTLAWGFFYFVASWYLYYFALPKAEKKIKATLDKYRELIGRR